MDLSIAIPATFSRLKYLTITLNSLRYQTFSHKKFEVVVAVDGGGHIGRIKFEIEQMNLPYKVKVIATERPFGEVAHRNHARNGAIRAASSNWVWVLDSDQLVENNAIKMIIKEKNKAIAKGVVPILVPVIFNMNYHPHAWIEKYNKWDKKGYNDFFESIKPKASAFSGYASMYKRVGGYTKLNGLQENMPVFHKKIFEAMDGFDESFIGWGGNKHEFSRRLDGLRVAGLVEIRLLHNVRLFHQSHPSGKKCSHDVSRSNQRHFVDKMNDIRYNRGDWPVQRRRVKSFLPLIKEDKPSDTLSISFVSIGGCKKFRDSIKDDAKTQSQFIGVYNKLPPLSVRKDEIIIRSAGSDTIGALRLGASCASGECIIFVDTPKQPKYSTLMSAYSAWTRLPDGASVFKPGACLVVERESYIAHNGLPAAVSDISECFSTFRDITNKGVTNTSIIKPELNWEPINLLNIQLISGHRKSKVSLGIITYNRRGVLQKELKSLMNSLRPDEFDYDIFITDDGSTDSTAEYLATTGLDFVTNSRGGVAAQANRVLSHFDGNVEYGFLSNDDLLFKRGWEELYIHAMKKTQYSHFVFMDLDLEQRVIGDRLYPPYGIIPFEDGYMVNWSGRRIEGAFMTFDQKVIDTVGGMDAPRFKLFGHEHVDWTVRIKRAKLAPGETRWIHGCYDILGSNNFVKLNLKDYKRSVKDSEIKKITGGLGTEYHFNKIEADPRRLYLPLITEL